MEKVYILFGEDFGIGAKQEVIKLVKINNNLEKK